MPDSRIELKNPLTDLGLNPRWREFLAGTVAY